MTTQQVMLWGMAWIQCYFFLFFIAGTALRNNSIVDMGWGIGFVLMNGILALQFNRFDSINLLMTVLVTLWGTRLFLHILKRNFGKPEDFRYANWRSEWGKYAVPRAFFQVYVLQGIMMWLIGLPLILMKAPYTAGEWSPGTAAGLLIWLVGFCFEVFGDRQLEIFKRNPDNKGRILDSGLWRYSRHPNYFGEAVMWWGMGIIGLAAGMPVFGMVSPLVITWLLRFVSGVPLLEKSFEKRPGFAEYKARTPIFVPWFPKNEETPSRKRI